jgi:hypothetical protein
MDLGFSHLKKDPQRQTMSLKIIWVHWSNTGTLGPWFGPLCWHQVKKTWPKSDWASFPMSRTVCVLNEGSWSGHKYDRALIVKYCMDFSFSHLKKDPQSQTISLKTIWVNTSSGKDISKLRYPFIMLYSITKYREDTESLSNVRTLINGGTKNSQLTILN